MIIHISRRIDMKKFLIAAALTALALVASPVTAKADGALNAANNFNNLQSNYLTQQNNYYNQNQVPVLNVYNQAMSNQYSQALAALFQAQIMQQQAIARNNANNFQMMSNFTADLTNYQTQMMNIASVNAYNTGMNAINLNSAALQTNANIVAAMNGQYAFPQYY